MEPSTQPKHSNCLLSMFIKKIMNYELGIIGIIKLNIRYEFTINEELKKAVDLWCSSKEDALDKYGHISYWDVSQITDMSGLFRSKKTFNDNISRWDVSNVENMKGMFNYALMFNNDISNWNVGNVKTMKYMFSDSKKFNQPIGNWDVSKVTTMNYMFSGAISFNQDLNNWDVSNVEYMNCMFDNTPLTEYPEWYKE